MVDIPARRQGKSYAMAIKVAADLREGRRVLLARISEQGEAVLENIVGVPGFADGKQLVAPTYTNVSRNCDGNSVATDPPETP